MQRRRFQVGRRHALRGRRDGYQVGQSPADPPLRGQPQGRPGCGFPPPTDPDADPDCPTVGINYCFTQASGSNLNVAAAAGVLVTITPVNASRAVPRSLLISVFDTGLNTRVLNGALTRAEVFGDNQLLDAAGVPLDRFNVQMPYLAENWRGFTPQNPYLLTILANAAANVDIRVTMDCDAIKGSTPLVFRSTGSTCRCRISRRTGVGSRRKTPTC